MTTSSPGQAIRPVGAVASKLPVAARVFAGGSSAVVKLGEMAGRMS